MLVASRSQLDQLSKREEVRRTGLYLLIGPDPDDPSRALASIGEGDNVLMRVLRHDENENLAESHAPLCGVRPRRFSGPKAAS